MGSPFPLLSSGQSIPDEQPGYSPRDFSMVPHTPQIIGMYSHRLTSDQSVPHTPDAAVVPNSQTNIAGLLFVTPGTATYYDNTETPRALLSQSTKDSPNVDPDQQVPATPQGGFLPPPYQSPVPYYTHFNSPPSSQSSQETAVSSDRHSIHTPLQSTHTVGLSTQNRVNSENVRHQAHTRQTPSLSSRRRLTLEPSLEHTSQGLPDKDLIQQITMSTNETPDMQNQSFSYCCARNHTSDHAQNNQKPCSSQSRKLNEACRDGVDFKYGLPQLKSVQRSSESSIVNKDSLETVSNIKNNNAMKHQPQSAQIDIHSKPPHVMPHIENVLYSPHQNNTFLKNNDKRAEIERRVQCVMDSNRASESGKSTDKTSMETPQGQTSILTLFADDDSIFGI